MNCPRPHHCPAILPDGSRCSSHPQYDKTGVIIGRRDDGTQYGVATRLHCYFGHAWETQIPHYPDTLHWDDPPRCGATKNRA